MRPTLTTLICALVLAAAACSSGGAEATSTTASSTTTTTTTAAPPAPPATTQPPVSAVALDLEMPDGAEIVLNSLYSWLVDKRNDPPPTPDELLQQLEFTARTNPGESGEVTWAQLENGDQVAVAQVDGDIILLVGDESGWRIVGAAMAGKTPVLGPEPRTVLILGSDARVGQNQQRFRADSVHLLTVVPGAGAGAIVGFPRDSWVQGPDGGTKLTNLMAGRGPEIMLETITEMTQLEIEGYFVTGFLGFTNLIEELGGLYIDLPTVMRSGNNWADYPAGPQELTAQRALRLARIRKGLPGGDFDRSFNQGLIMQAAMDMVQLAGIELLPQWVRVLSDNTWTDLSTAEVLTLGAAAYLLPSENLVNIVLPGSVGTAGAASVVYLSDAAENIYRDLEDGLLTPEE
ncbi:MAG: LCP family protein [Acidimicrobiia bacterium]|nr:LCP family protein [Acidimicrobiia bacterium]